MAKIVHPPVISVSARRVKSRKDQHETSIAVRMSSRGQSVTRPASASRGAKAIEWTRMSRRPHLAAIAYRRVIHGAGRGNHDFAPRRLDPQAIGVDRPEMLAPCDKGDVLAGACELCTEEPSGPTRSKYDDAHSSLPEAKHPAPTSRPSWR